MSRWQDEDDGEGPESADDGEDVIPQDEDEPTTACPYCRREIHEDSQRCPYCEHYISREDAPPARKPWWILLGVALGLYAVYRWVFG